MDGAEEAIPAPGSDPIAGPGDPMAGGSPAGVVGPHGDRWVPACPFLSAISADDRLRTPVLAPDPANRCASSGVPTAVLGRDQVALCLGGAHETCPRYVRATIGPAVEAPVPPARRISLPILAAVALLVVAAAAGGASVALRGDLSAGGVAAGAATTAATSPAGGAPDTAGTTPSPVATGVAGAAPSGSPSPPPSASPSAAPASASPLPVVAPTAAPPTPVTYAGLTPCRGVPDCYVYVVERGDNLTRVAARYGLTLDAILARNPTITDPSRIVKGQKVRLPTPRK